MDEESFTYKNYRQMGQKKKKQRKRKKPKKYIVILELEGFFITCD